MWQVYHSNIFLNIHIKGVNMHNLQFATIGIGIALGMLFYRRTGRSCGGIITPGFIALQLGNPLSVGIAIGTALFLALLLEIIVRFTGIYGRQRIALAMLMALGCKVLLDLFFPSTSLWLGWVVPGLLAADMQRQGIGETLIGTVIVTLLTAMSFDVLVGLGHLLERSI